MSGPFRSGAVVPGSTVEEVAAHMVAAPAWGFASDPARAIAHATSRAADAATFSRVDPAQSEFWTKVAAALVAAADSPHADGGAILRALRHQHGVPE